MTHRNPVDTALMSLCLRQCGSKFGFIHSFYSFIITVLVSLIWTILVLRFLLHSCAPGRAAGGSPGITSAASGAFPSAVAPTPSSAPAQVVAAHTVASAEHLGGSAVQCTCAAAAPACQHKTHTQCAYITQNYAHGIVTVGYSDDQLNYLHHVICQQKKWMQYKR